MQDTAVIDPPYDEAMQHRFDHLVGSNPLLLEVTKMEGGASLPRLFDRIVALLRTRLRYGMRDAIDIVTTPSRAPVDLRLSRRLLAEGTQNVWEARPTSAVGRARWLGVLAEYRTAVLALDTRSGTSEYRADVKALRVSV